MGGGSSSKVEQKQKYFSLSKKGAILGAIGGTICSVVVGGIANCIGVQIGAVTIVGLFGLVGAGALVGAALAGGITYLFTSQYVYRNRGGQIEKSSIAIPQFKAIQMTQKQFDQIVDLLTSQQFEEQCKLLTCPMTYQIFREPYQMNCCKSKANLQDYKCVEKVFLEQTIEKFKKCPLCQQSADASSMVKCISISNQIFGFRCQLYKTYRCLPEDQKPKWKESIDKHFGEGYTDKHLEKPFKPIN